MPASGVGCVLPTVSTDATTSLWQDGVLGIAAVVAGIFKAASSCDPGVSNGADFGAQ
jgi:hypothetical protein